ncbi:hypothetical protein A2U01_0026620, partial [Trifolium medium]|nr:hypothetical protein [Trifolium medium]
MASSSKKTQVPLAGNFEKPIKDSSEFAPDPTTVDKEKRLKTCMLSLVDCSLASGPVYRR